MHTAYACIGLRQHLRDLVMFETLSLYFRYGGIIVRRQVREVYQAAEKNLEPFGSFWESLVRTSIPFMIATHSRDKKNHFSFCNPIAYLAYLGRYHNKCHFLRKHGTGHRPVPDMALKALSIRRLFRVPQRGLPYAH